MLSEMDQVEQVAFCDVVEEKAAAFSQEFTDGKAPVFTDFREMFKKMELNVVYISLPPFAHSNEVEWAAKHGCHVFIEKPIALDMQTANRMVNAVKKAGVKSQVGFQLRFGEAVEAIKAMIESGEAGPVGLAIARYICDMTGAKGWWRDKSRSGGQVVEQIIHLYDLLRYLLGDAETVFCRMTDLFHRSDQNWTVEDASGTVITFRNGAIATVSGTSSGIPTKWISNIQLVAKKRTIDLEDMNHATIYHTDTPSATSITIASVRKAQVAMHQELISAIRKGHGTRTPISEGAKTLQLVLGARESAETGKVVRLR